MSQRLRSGDQKFQAFADVVAEGQLAIDDSGGFIRATARRADPAAAA
jgi:hypothetical protein